MSVTVFASCDLRVVAGHRRERDDLYAKAVERLLVVCFKIHMKQILEYKEAAHVPYAYFGSYFKGGDAKTDSKRMFLLVATAPPALEARRRGLIRCALDELFHNLNELEIVDLRRRRLLELGQQRYYLFEFSGRLECAR